MRLEFIYNSDKIHVLHNQKHVPRKGDEVRFGQQEMRYVVAHVGWHYMAGAPVVLIFLEVSYG